MNFKIVKNEIKKLLSKNLFLKRWITIFISLKKIIEELYNKMSF